MAGEEPGAPIYRVIGKRLSYLSWHEGVRKSILDRVGRGNQDVRAVAKNVRVTINEDGKDVVLRFNVRDDTHDEFVANLNRLLPGPPRVGDLYAEDVGNEDDTIRKHDWDKWDKELGKKDALRRQLRDAVVEVLRHNKPVQVFGEEQPQMEVEARYLDDPQLIFEVPPDNIDKP